MDHNEKKWCLLRQTGKHSRISWSATCSYGDSRKSIPSVSAITTWKQWLQTVLTVYSHLPGLGLELYSRAIIKLALCLISSVPSKKKRKKNLCSLNGLWATQSAGEGSRKETLMSDQPRHIATVKLLTPFPIFWSSSCEGLYLPISCRDVTAADWGLWSCHPHWCFVTRLSTASPSCFIFHAARQTCPSLHPRTVIKLELKWLSFVGPPTPPSQNTRPERDGTAGWPLQTLS